MKTIFISSIFILLSVSIFAQQEPFSINKKSFGETVFYKDFLNFFSNKSGLTRVDVFVQVPYKNIQFVKSSEGFTAKYSVTASVFDSTKTMLIVEKTWNETVNVIDFNMTTEKYNYNLSKKSFDLKPGKYLIRTNLEDLDSKKETASENPFIVKDFSGKISLSDILLIAKSENIQANNSIVPNVSRNISSSKDRVKFYFEVNSKYTAETRFTFEYKVTDSENKIIHREEEDRNLNPGINQIFFSMTEFPFDLGAYIIKVTISDAKQNIVATNTKPFYSQSRALPAIITDIDKAIAQTIFIATPDELSYMEEGKTQPEKMKRFLEFWKKKDPSPNNDENEVFDEYYKRVEYANENFSSYIEGWKSDRGMVFILLGAPNNIDRHPFEYDSKPYEVWEYYNLNRSFVFLDQTGFGDYRLITPLTGDLYRYRY
jgi:GWxTD domain-containing protein